MDIIPKFFIFGVPDGFDLLDGTTGYVTYFQKFYISDSKENTRFSIHRDAKGNITYTYLKYNLSSANSRAGSFFGMSLIFQNVYCSDPLSLFKLFDMVYNTYILIDETKEKEGKAIGFIRPIHGNKDIQARYDKITRFQDKRDYIQHYIENVLLANINDNFKNDFYLIDSSFSNEQPDLVVQEPLQSVSNERLLADLRQFNRVAVSPDWVPSTPLPGPNGSTQKQDTAVRTIVLAPEVIGSLLEYTKGYQNYIIDSLNDIAAADIETANDVYKEVAASLKKVKTIPSTDKRVSQIISDYTILVEQLQNLIQKIEEGPTHLPPPPMPWWKNPKILGIMGGALIVMIVLVIAIIHLHNESVEKNELTHEKQIETIATVRKCIEEKDYTKAKKMVGDIADLSLRTHLSDSIVFCIVDDKTAPKDFIKFTDTWKKYADDFLGDEPNLMRQRALDTIANRRWRYIETLVEQAEITKTKKSKEYAENAIKLGEDTELHNNEKAQEFRSRLNKIHITSRSASGSGVGTSSRSTTTPSAPQYTIKIWKTDLRYSIEDRDKYVGMKPDYTISTSQIIRLEKGSRYSCQVLHNGSTFEIENVVKIKQESCIVKRENDWIRIPVPDWGLENEYIEIKGANLKITFKTK